MRIDSWLIKHVYAMYGAVKDYTLATVSVTLQKMSPIAVSGGAPGLRLYKGQASFVEYADKVKKYNRMEKFVKELYYMHVEVGTPIEDLKVSSTTGGVFNKRVLWVSDDFISVQQYIDNYKRDVAQPG